MPKIVKVKKGDIYNKLSIIKELKNNGGHRYFECKCKCGNITIVRLNSLRTGYTKSCGCLHKGSNKTHGKTNTRIYRIWIALNTRCKDINNKNYGGRGIKCEWKTFEEFYKDMGNTYKENLTIEREKNDGNYCKKNCKWKTPKQQARNRRSNTMITINGITKTFIEWTEIYKLKYGKIYLRIFKYKRTVEEAFEIVKR